jgi:anti-anti-sigma factor
VVRLAGELDLATEDDLRSVVQDLLSRRDCDIVLDLSRLRFADVRGLRAIIWSSETVRGRGRVMRIVGVPKQIRRLLELTGHDKTLNLEPSRTGNADDLSVP